MNCLPISAHSTALASTQAMASCLSVLDSRSGMIWARSFIESLIFMKMRTRSGALMWTFSKRSSSGSPRRSRRSYAKAQSQSDATSTTGSARGCSSRNILRTGQLRTRRPERQGDFV